ncbi:hypothetical protein HYW75_04635 [Candidatus Pacearchaeota archaeon]|nr:hypothetical protein [Candidatus Pacearchaeota archaeon]
MKQIITFKDLERKYNQVSGLIDKCMEMVTRNNPLDTTPYASWVHLPTLARWSYDSSQESLREFRLTIKIFLDTNEENNAYRYLNWSRVYVYDSILSEKVSSFKDKLLLVFGTSDEKLAGVLSK